MPRTSCARLLLVLLVLLAATSASAQGVSYLGGWSGGPPDRVEANDQIAVVATGGIVEILDVHVLDSPATLASIDCGDVLDLALDGSRLLVAASQFGLRVIDVANPAAPTVVGEVLQGRGVRIRSVVSDGTTAYVSADSLYSVDLGTMQVLDAISTSAASQLLVVEGVLYAQNGAVVRSYDVLDPTQIAYMASWAPYVIGPGFETAVFDMTWFGNTLIVVGSADDGFGNRFSFLYEVAGTLGGAASYYMGGGFLDMRCDASDSLLVVQERYGDCVLYERNEWNALVAHGEIPAHTSAVDLEVPSADRIFVLDYAKRLRAFAADGFVDPMVASESTLGWGETVAATRAADVVYAANSLPGLVVLDVTDPQSVSVLDSLHTSATPNAVTIEGTLAYLPFDGGLHVVDVTDPSAVSTTAELAMTANLGDFVVSGDAGYAPAGPAGLLVFDLTVPAAPVWVATVDVGGDLQCIELADGTLLAAVSEVGIRALDLTDPLTPTDVGGYPSTAGFRDLSLDGNLLHSVTTASRDLVLDVGTPAAITQVSNEYLVYAARAIDIESDFAYVASSSYGLRLFDVADASAPAEVGSLSGGFYLRDVHVTNGVATCASGAAGVSLFRNDLLTNTAVNPVPDATRGGRVAVHPNPFNPRTTLSFELDSEQVVSLAIYDVAGRRLRTLLGSVKFGSGAHEVIWDGKDDGGVEMASGAYLARLDVGGQVRTGSLTLVR